MASVRLENVSRTFSGGVRAVDHHPQPQVVEPFEGHRAVPIEVTRLIPS